jgi:phosphatidate cytidylyltransferase
MTAATKPKRSNLAVRFMTAGVAAPVILWMLFFAPAWVWPFFVLVLAQPIAAQELYAMVLRGQKFLIGYGIVSCVAFGLALFSLLASPMVPGRFPVLDSTLAPITLVLWALITLLVSLSAPTPNKEAGFRMGWLLGGPLYIGSALAVLAALHSVDDHGGGWVLLSMTLAWFADTAGYFAGRFLGKKVFGDRQFSPDISPNKTWEGAIGAVGGSLIAIVLAHFSYLPTLPLAGGAVVALVAGPVGVCGDLVESLIKRSTGAKDSGWIVPGHGGLIDRIDALMYTATVTFVYARYLLPG